MVTASIIHGGPGLPVFPRVVYLYFQNPNPYDLIESVIIKEDVVDIDVVMALDKVENKVPNHWRKYSELITNVF